MAKGHYIKDKKITIMETVIESDELGNQIEETKPINNGENIWTYYRQASADEYYAASQVNYRVDAIFKISWRDNIHHSNTILFRGQEYNITRIDDFEGYKRDLTIYAYMKE